MKKLSISRILMAFAMVFAMLMNSTTAFATESTDMPVENANKFDIGEETEYGTCIGYSLIPLESESVARSGERDGDQQKTFWDIDGISFSTTTKIDEDTTAVYWLTGNENLRFKITITDPDKATFTDLIYANGGKKAHTFSAGAGTYKFEAEIYSGTALNKIIYIYVYFFN